MMFIFKRPFEFFLVTRELRDGLDILHTDKMKGSSIENDRQIKFSLHHFYYITPKFCNS